MVGNSSTQDLQQKTGLELAVALRGVKEAFLQLVKKAMK